MNIEAEPDHDRVDSSVPDAGALLIGVGHVMETTPADEEPAGGQPSWHDLPFVYEVMPSVQRALEAMGYRTLACTDPDADKIRNAVKDFFAGHHGQIVYVNSHGATERSADPHRVDVVPACGDIGIGTNVSDWVSLAQTKKRHTLFLLDLCRSGRAARLPFLLQHGGKDTFAWVIAASGPQENAYDGRFSVAVAHVLKDLAENGFDTHPARQYVAFSVVARHIRAQVERMPGVPQTVLATPLDLALDEPELPFFPNPAYRDDPQRHERMALDPPVRAFLDDAPGLRTQDAEHFSDRAGRHFTGRREQVKALAEWLDGGGGSPLRVVTGSPGAGKSALLGALACAAHPALARVAPHVRVQLAAQDPSGCPSYNDNLAVVHARQRTLHEVMRSLARQLQLKDPDRAWTVAALINNLRELKDPPWIVLDALDEAQGAADIATELLSRLVADLRSDGRPMCWLLVGMRPWEQFEGLRKSAADRRGLIDLDDVPPQQVHSDLVAYLTSRLMEIAGYGTVRQKPVREALAEAVATQLTTTTQRARRREWGAFLVAEIYARYLEAARSVTSADAARVLGRSVPVTLPQVLELDLRERSYSGEARAMLAAIAHSKGDGMPAELAHQVGRALTGRALANSARELLNAAKFYLRMGADDEGTSVYRLFHQGLADYLCRHPLAPPVQDTTPTPAAAATAAARASSVLDGLLTDVRAPAAQPNRWSTAPRYLLQHAIDHALDADRVDELISDSEFLVHADRHTLLPALNAASSVDARLAAAVYRATGWEPEPKTTGPAERRHRLAVDAARFGDDEMLQRLTASLPPGSWRPRWATGTAAGAVRRPERSLSSNWLWSVATARLGHSDVAVTGDDQGHIGLWDLHNSSLMKEISTGHTRPVGAVACATVNTHSLAVSASYDGTVRVWDLAANAAYGDPLVGFDRYITDLDCVTISGRAMVVGAGFDGTLYQWDLLDCRAHGAPLRGHDRAVTTLACTDANGTPLAISAAEDKRLLMWDLEQNTLLRELAPGSKTVTRAAAWVRFKGRLLLITGDSAGVLRAWEPHSGNLLWAERSEHSGAVVQLAGTLVAGTVSVVAVGDDGAISVWAVDEHGARRERLFGTTHKRYSAVACTTVDGQPTAVAVGYENRQATQKGYDEDGPGAVSDSGTGQSQYNGNLWTWDLTGDQTAPLVRRVRDLIGHTKAVVALSAGQTANGPVVVSAGQDGEVFVRDARTGVVRYTPISTFRHLGVNSLQCVTVDGRALLLTTSARGDAAPKQNSPKPVTQGWAGYYDDVDYARPGEAFETQIGRPADHGAASSDAGAGDSNGLETAWLWDLDASQGTDSDPRRPLLGASGRLLTARCLTLAGQEVAVSGGETGEVALWSLRSAELLTSTFTHSDPITAVVPTQVNGQQAMVVVRQARRHRKSAPRVVDCMQLRGRTVAVTGHGDGSVRVADLETRRLLLAPLRGHTGPVAALVCATLDGRPSAVTGSADQTVRVWDLESGNCECLPMPGPVSALCMMNDGSVVVGAGSDVVVLEWVPTADVASAQ